MMNVGRWRWPLTTLLTLLTGAGLLASGMLSIKYQGDLQLRYGGDPKAVEAELEIFRFHPVVQATFERVPAHPADVQIRLLARWPNEVVRLLNLTANACIDRSVGRQKAVLGAVHEQTQKLLTAEESKIKALMDEKAAAPVITRPGINRAAVAEQIKDLKYRRSLLIERFPTHSEIPVLAKRIQELQAQLNKPTGSTRRLAPDFHRQLNQSLYRQSILTKQMVASEKALKDLKPLWKISAPAQKPKWPMGVKDLLIGLFVIGIVFALCFFFLKGGAAAPETNTSNQGLWRPEAEVPEQAAEVLASDVPAPSDDIPVPVALEVIKPEVPSDPLTEKAAGLYAKWVDLAKLLYSPSAEPPQGVFDQVGPLLQESTEFLPQGHEVLAKYLARSVEPGNLSAHVARTVLMTLTGAREAGVTPVHQLAMALAALFHDLAMVSRPAAMQSEIGSEVGRLSASVLKRIPGLPPVIVTMVEDILIGMDEFKLKTWQNAATGQNLEPLSKVLREIDRFEKVMQKQKARLERRVANQ